MLLVGIIAAMGILGRGRNQPGRRVMQLLFISWMLIGFTFSTNIPGNQETESGTCSDICLFDHHFFKVACNDRSLTYVPSSTGCEGAIRLLLQENRLQGISSHELSGYNNMEYLDISGNDISVVNSGAFQELHHLKIVICSHNKVEIVPDGIFNGTEGKLEKIYFNDNQIHTIGDRAFQGLSHVIFLYLNDNNISTLVVKIFHDLINMKSLILSNNKIHHLVKDQFTGLTRLQYLSLNGNNLKCLPEGLFYGLESLKSVLLFDNKLLVLPAPESLGLNFNNLEMFDLRNNHLNQSSEIIPYLTTAACRVDVNDNPLVCDCSFQHIQDWHKENPNSQAITMTCTFTNGTVHSISDYLQINCSDTYRENDSVVTDAVTVSLKENSMQSTTLQKNKNVGQDQQLQLYRKIIAILAVLIVFCLLGWPICFIFGHLMQRKQRLSIRSEMGSLEMTR